MDFTKDSKFFINEYGIFYEGQILDKYDRHGVFLGKIKLKKFIIHYKEINRFTRIPKLYFSLSEPNKTLNFTLSSRDLGIYYKIPQTRKNKPN